jgi:hypothetical protein
MFLMTPLQLAESDAELNALKVMVDNVVAFFYPSESSSEVCAPPDARQTADEISGDYSHQYETVGESNPRDPKVPIPLSRLGCSG